MTDKPTLLDRVDVAISNVAKVLHDGWVNMKTGIGTRRDRRSHTLPVVDYLNFEQCTTIYRASDILARAVDEPVTEAFKKGFRISIKDEDGEDEDGMTKAQTWSDDHLVLEKLQKAIRWARQYGGAAILIGANDGQTADMPLNEDRIRSIDYVTVLDKRECVPIDWYDSPAALRYREPSFYRVTPYVFSSHIAPREESVIPNAVTSWVNVHASRIIPLVGKQADTYRVMSSDGWGDSLFQAVWRIVADYDSGLAATSTLLSEFSVPVFKVKGLAALMSADKDDALKKRIDLINLSRSVINGIMVDADGEDFERKSASLSGVDSALVQLASRVAAALNYPVTKLFGVSPGGLNATGSADIEFWNDMLGAINSKYTIPTYTRILRLAFLAKNGPTGGVLPDSWCVEPPALKTLTETEKATRNLTQAQADQIYLANGVTSPEEIRRSRFGGPAFSVETQIDNEGDLTEEDDDLLENEGVPRIDPATGQPVQQKPGAQGTGPAGADIQAQALNGAQVTSMLEIVRAVAGEEIPRQAGIAIMKRAFQVTEQEAAELLGPENFKPKEPVPQPSPFGGGAPGTPGAKPAVAVKPEPKPGDE